MKKKCTKCGEVKAIDLFYNRTRGGKQSQCKECFRERSRKYRLENPEKARAKDRKYRLENPEKVRDVKRKWYLENPEKIREYNREKVDSLSDGYVALILKASGLPPEIIEDNPEIVELKRLQIKLNRKINQKKKEL